MRNKFVGIAFGLLLSIVCLLAMPGQAQHLQTGTTAGVYYAFPVLSAAGTSPWIAVNNVIPTKHGMQVNTTGSPASCTYNLEGSADGVNATALLTAQACTTSGTLTWEATGTKPVLFVRVNVTALSAASSVSAIYIGSK